MKNFVTHRSQVKDILSRYGFLIFSSGLVLFSFALLPHYGIVGDTLKNLSEGRINLDYLLSGKPPAIRNQMDLVYQIHGAFIFMCAELVKRLLSDALGWIGPISAQHALLPICVFFFMNAYFRFLKKNTGLAIAWIATVILWTYPRFWGLIFNDIKDIPLFLFFSLFVFYLYGWIRSRYTKTRLLYGASIMLGLGMANKVTILLAPLIVLVWWITFKISEKRLIPDIKSMLAKPLSGNQKRILFHIALCGGIIAFLVAIFFMPAFYALTGKIDFLRAKSGVIHNNLFIVFTRTWNLYPWIQIFTVTPCLVLITGIVGFFRTLLRPVSKPFDLLMLIWFLMIMLIFCTPLLVVYHGIRLFLPFLVPFCYFVARGTLWVTEAAGRFFHVKKVWLTWILAGLMLSTQILGLIKTHPYQALFYNAGIGGLKGAQQKELRDANDFWGISSRESSRWINQNLPPGSLLLFSTVASYQLYEYYGIRPDIRYDFVRRTPLPRRSFLLYQPSTHPGKDAFGVHHEEIEKETIRMIKLYEVRRQGGLIYSIYYKP